MGHRRGLKRFKSKLYHNQTYINCCYCFRPLPYSEGTVEHIIPVALGGTNDIVNLTIACNHCNSTRPNHLSFEDWKKRIHSMNIHLQTYHPIFGYIQVYIQQNQVVRLDFTDQPEKSLINEHPILDNIVAILNQKPHDPVQIKLTGSLFQIKVWNELRKLKQPISYQELANRIELPTAVRAVANACGQNKIALLVPCHLVIRKNGDLGGYKCGIERKKKLLELINL